MRPLAHGWGVLPAVSAAIGFSVLSALANGCSPAPAPAGPAPAKARRAASSCDRPDRLWPDMFWSLPSSFRPASYGLDETLLGAMNEPQLWCGEAPDSFRFLWVHSMSTMPKYPPTAVRVSRDSEGWYIRAVQLVSFGRREIQVDQTRRLSPQETQPVLGALERFDVWRRNDFENGGAEDGSGWLIEARASHAYHPMILINADQNHLEATAGLLLDLVDIDPAILREGIDVDKASHPNSVPPSP